MLDGDGKIEDKTPIFNDLLAFIWNKMGVCSRDHLVKAALEFYKMDFIKSARDLLHKCSPSDQRRPLHRKAEDILVGIYNEFQGLPTGHELVFVALNLNNIPCVNLTSIDGASLVYKQNSVNETLNGILEESKFFREEMTTFKNLLKSTWIPKPHTIVETQPSGVSAGVVPVEVSDVRNSVNPDVNVPAGNSQPSFSSVIRNSMPLSHNDRGVGVQDEDSIRQPPAKHGTWQTVDKKKKRRKPVNMVTGQKTGNELGAIEGEEILDVCEQTKS